jgi:hypothetical protein
LQGFFEKGTLCVSLRLLQRVFSGRLWWKRTFKLEELALSRPKESEPLLTIVSYGDGEVEENGEAELAAAKTALLPVAVEIEMDSGERRLNELGYKQELRREMTLFKCLAIAFSTMTLFTGITPLYGNSFRYAGPVGLVWGWVVVTFFTWFMGFAMAEICSSFPVSSLHLPVLIIIIIIVINIIFHLFLDFFCSERLDLFLNH